MPKANTTKLYLRRTVPIEPGCGLLVHAGPFFALPYIEENARQSRRKSRVPRSRSSVGSTRCLKPSLYQWQEPAGALGERMLGQLLIKDGRFHMREQFSPGQKPECSKLDLAGSHLRT